MTYPPFTFSVPKSRLPSDIEERYELLYSLFSNSHIQCEQAYHSWKITLSSPSNLDFYIDSGLSTGLKWWGVDCSVEQIPYARKSTPYGKLMLQDTWTLESWMEVYNNTGISRITILHFDHHSDLMNPFVAKTADGFIHLTSKQKFSFFDSKSIEGGVQQGTIFQGCYIVPFFHVCDTVSLIHITQKKVPNGVYHLTPSCESLSPIFSDSSQTLSIKTKKVRNRQQNLLGESILYQVTELEDVETILQNNTDPIFLHIDMDYFCNRYNRQSDWASMDNFYDRSFLQIEQRILDISQIITQVSQNNSILHTDIALVPGFFPAEFWKDSIDLVAGFLPKI